MNTVKFLIYLLSIASFTVIYSCGAEGIKNGANDPLKTGQKDTCSTKNQETESTNTLSTVGKEYTSTYVCPQHCKGSGSEKSGTCTRCGMDLIENPSLKK